MCPACGHGNLTRDTRPVTYRHAGHTVTVQQPGLYCDGCGEALFEPADIAATRDPLVQLLAASERSAQDGRALSLDDAVGDAIDRVLVDERKGQPAIDVDLEDL